MLSAAKLLRVFTELVMLLLGLLLVVVAVTGRVRWDRRSMFWFVLGVFLVYWGLRA